MATLTANETGMAGRVAPRPARRGWRTVAWLLAGLGALAGVGRLGLRVEPPPLEDPGFGTRTVATVPLREGLPPPVERFYRELYGDRVPLVDTAAVTGRGELRIAGLTFPARFRFTHVTGREYRHEIELAFFGRRLTAVEERFVDGHARLDLPFGVSEGPRVDQGANLALWAEAVWMPSVWVTDPRVSWLPDDDASARLSVPFGDGSETFTVEFDPDTGLLSRMESMRFKGASDDAKTRWINEITAWGRVHGRTLPRQATITWADEGTPWARLRTEQVVYNARLPELARPEAS